MHSMIVDGSRDANDYRNELGTRAVTAEAQTVTALLDYWGSSAFPATCACVSKLLDLAATEADCERAFSVLKAALPSNRSLAGPTTSTAHILHATSRNFAMTPVVE
jgi:hypothetical protein